MKASGDCAAKRASKRSTTACVDAAALELAQLVAQRRDALRCGSGWPRSWAKMVARVRLEGQHRRRQAAVRASLLSSASIA